MDRKRRLMENNNGWPLRSQLLDGAPFYAQLTNSLVLNRGTGSPTYTGATTKTFPDNEGVLRTAIAGEARFVGARRVRNLLPASTEDLSSAGFTRFNATASTDTLTASVGAGFHYTYSGSGSYTAATKYIYSVEVERTNNDWIFVGLNDGQLSYFNTTTGLFGTTDGTVSSASATLVSAGVYRIALAAIPGAVAVKCTVGIANANGGASFVAVGTETIKARKFQLEDITGRADQTTPSEYVSVGVLSAPYHGAGVDGVKYFDTDLSGNPIAASTLKGYLAEPAATNLCTKSQEFDAWTKGNGGAGSLPVVTANDGVAPDGTTTADKVVFAAPGAGDISALTSPAFATTVASSYTSAVYIKAFAAGDVGKQILTRQAGAAGYTAKTLTADWQRLGTTETAIGDSTSIDIVLRPTFGGSSGTVSVYLWGAQVELGSAATSYIPTTTVAVARNADVESVPTSGNIIAASGWISLTYTPTHAPSGTVFLWGTYVDASNYTAILHDATNLIFRKRIAGTNYDATIANAFVSGTTYKMAATWGASGTGIALNGTLGTGHANTTAAQIGTAMQTGADGNGANQPGMSLGNERIGQRQLSSSELQAITR